MLTPEARAELEKQQYRIIGHHSAVKPCGWTKTMIRGGGGCYKLKFYGIKSDQCLQMTTSLSCANRCVFCWRGYKAPVSKEWTWPIDEPGGIIEESIRQHHKLLVGFKGSEKADRSSYERSNDIRHVALSLTGEPITYPRINELLTLFNQRGISTFMVTNAQYPDAIKNLAPVTQLYLSLDQATKEGLKAIDKPLFPDYWERLNLSLDYLSQKKQRTAIRLTLVKGLNIRDAHKYAELILKGSPDFVEVKAYMHVGASIERLERENMPEHHEVLAFAKELLQHLPGYAIVADHIPSLVVMLAKEKYRVDGKWMTWIDFEKWNSLVLSGNDFSSMEYLAPTPSAHTSDGPNVVDEKTKEMEFWNGSAKE